MRKHGKKIMSCILAFSMVVGLCMVSEPMETDAAKTVTLYEENFDSSTITSLEEEGWNIFTASGNKQYYIVDGSLQGKQGNSYYANTDAYSWTNYTYETDFTIGTKPDNTAETGYWGIRFGVNSNGVGVEYRIKLVVAEDGTHSFMYNVHDRINDNTYIGDTAITGQDLAMDKAMTLKVKLDGASFTVYLNGEELATKTMTNTVTGTIGTYMNAACVYTYYDNMKVTQEVDPVATEDTLLLETFSSKSKPTTWAKGLPSSSENYSTETLMMDTSQYGYESYYIGSDDGVPYTWENYTYVAQLRFEKFPVNDHSKYWYCINVGRGSATDYELEFGILYDVANEVWKWRVCNRASSGTTIPLSGDVPESVDILVGEPVEMKATVCGNYISVYINEVCLGTTKVSGVIKGTVGIQVPNGAGAIVYYDDLHVTKNCYASGEMDVISPVDFATLKDGETPFIQENGWLIDSNNYVVQNGAVQLNNTAPYPTSYHMADGYISAELKLEKPDILEEGTYYGPAQITARDTNAHSADSYDSRLRFVVVCTEGVSKIKAQAVIYSGSSPATFDVVTGLAYDTVYQFRIICIGNELVFGVFDEAGSVLGEKHYLLAADNGLNDREGAFGIGVGAAGTTIPAYVNKVRVHQFQPYTITDDCELVDVIVSGTTGAGSAKVTPSKFYAGETVTVNVTGDIAAGSLQYTYTDDGTVTANIFAQPAGTDKGSGAGNVFVFTMPADNITLQTEAYTGVKDSMASVATSLAEEGNAIRFLNRIYLPELLPNGGFNNSHTEDYNDGTWTIVDCGAIVLPTNLIPSGGELTLDTANIAKVSMTAENFKLYDKTTEYLDFTVKLTNISDAARSYSVRTYVTLQSGEQKVTLYGNTLEQSINGLVQAY